MRRSEGYVLMVVSIVMVVIFSILHLGFFILRNRVKEDKKEASMRIENQRILNGIREYEKEKMERLGIEYLTGKEKIWTVRQGISPGKYHVERVVSGMENIYVQGDPFIPSERMKLDNFVKNIYKIYFIKNMQMRDRDMEVRIMLEVEYLPRNLEHNFPDGERCLSITMRMI